MKNTRVMVVATAAAVALGLSACAGSTTPGTTPSGSAGGGAGAAPSANAALTAVFNPSDKKGGTLRFGSSGDFDSVDPGDTYYNDFLADVPAGYSVYKDKNLDDLKSITTPDDKTIVFHLNKPFAGFDYFAQLSSTAPVPQAKDTGTKYKEHVIVSGPYKFSLYQPGKRIELVRNDQYDPKTDPDSGRKALPDKITVEIGVNAADLDNRLMAGDIDIDLAGTVVPAAAQGKILADPTLKAHTDNPTSARANYAQINSDVAPFDNLDCRKAVIFASDKTGYQRAY